MKTLRERGDTVASFRLVGEANSEAVYIGKDFISYNDATRTFVTSSGQDITAALKASFNENATITLCGCNTYFERSTTSIAYGFKQMLPNAHVFGNTGLSFVFPYGHWPTVSGWSGPTEVK